MKRETLKSIIKTIIRESMHEASYETSMRNNPEGDANQAATRDNRRAVFAAKMQAAAANDETESMENKKTMTVLLISQHSRAETFMRVSYDWKTYTPKFRPFDEIADKFPEVVREVTPEQGPSWGSAFYIKGEDGMPIMYKEHWDTSG